MVDKTLKGLCGVAKTKWHLQKFKESERGGYGRLVDIRGFHWDLVVSSHQIPFRENSISIKGGCKVLDMRDGITVGLGGII